MIGDLNRAGRSYSFEVLRAKALLAYGRAKERTKLKRLTKNEMDGAIGADPILFCWAPEPEVEYGIPISTLGAAIANGFFQRSINP